MNIRKFELWVVILAILIPVYTLAQFTIFTGSRGDRMRFEIMPGGSQTGSVVARNSGEKELVLKLYPADGLKTRDGNFAMKLTSDEQTGLGMWTSVSESELTLKPYETREINFTITLPTDVPPGDYSGGIALEQTGKGITLPSTSSTSSTKVNARMAVPFFVHVPGEKVRNLEWTSFIHEYKESNGHTFYMAFYNRGNVALSIDTLVTIEGEELPHNNVTLYPNEKVEIPLKWEKKPFFGLFGAKAKVTYYENDLIGGQKIFIGNMEKTLEFIVIPWMAIIIILLILLALSIINYVRKKIRAALIMKSKPYIVKNGDSLMSIAKENNVEWQTLAKINKLKPPYGLEPNQQILIPPSQK